LQKFHSIKAYKNSVAYILTVPVTASTILFWNLLGIYVEFVNHSYFQEITLLLQEFGFLPKPKHSIW